MSPEKFVEVTMHLVSRFTCNGRVKRAQNHHLYKTNYWNKI